MPDAWEKLSYELDLSLRVVRIGKQYPASATVSKSRLTGFSLGDNFQLTYDEFSNRYGKDFIESSTTQIKVATQEQVEEIERLLSLLKISDDDKKLILSKAKANEISDLTEEQAKKTIEFYTKKLTGKAE
jgi:hypothetical protein